MDRISIDHDVEITHVPPEPDPTITTQAYRIDLVAILHALGAKRRFLGRCVLAGLLFFVALAFLIPPQYEATTQLMPPDHNANLGPLMAALSSQASMLPMVNGLLGGRSSGALFVGILKSQTVQDRIIQQYDLRKVYGVRLNADARKILTKNTSAVEESRSGIITLTVTDRDPKRAAAMAHSYVDQLDALSALLTTSAAHRERVFIEERLKVVKQDLDSAAAQFSKFTSKNTVIDVPQQGKAMVEAAATISGQLIAAETEVQGLKQIYADNNVRVRAAEARVAELKTQLQQLRGTDAASTDKDSFPSIRQLPILGVTYFDLYRQMKIQEAVYENLTGQYELAKIDEAKEIPTVRVLDVATVPERKSYPPRTLIVLGGTILSFGFGVLIVLGTAAWERYEDSDPRKILVRDLWSAMMPIRTWLSPARMRWRSWRRGE